MNKLITTNNGGMPYELDDIRWLDETYRDAWYGLLSAIGVNPQDSFRISGCVVTVGGGTYSWTDGYIALNGEVLKVDAGSIPSPGVGQGNYWVVEITNHPDGTEQFETGATFNTYEQRRGILQTKPISLTDMPAAAPYLYEKLVSLIVQDNGNLELKAFVQATIASQAIYALIAQPAWKYIGDPGEPAFQNGWVNAISPNRKASFRKSTVTLITLTGLVSHGTYNASKAVIFTLPVGYRPAQPKNFACATSSAGFVSILVNTNGEVSISLAGAPASFQVDLSSIHFYIDQ